MSDAPRRRWVLDLKLGADTFEDMCRALDNLERELRMRPGIPDGGGRREMCSGGPDSGYHATLSEDQSVSHTSYFAAVEEFISKRRKSA